jgi:hypothetical protein
VRSDIDLRRFAWRSGGTGAYAIISLCPFRRNPMVSIGRVQHNGIDLATEPGQVCEWDRGVSKGCRMVNDSPAERAEAGTPLHGGRYIYEIPFVYDDSQMEDYTDKFGGRTARFIPLPPDRDYCMRIDEGGIPGWTTNAVRIPKEAIARLRGMVKLGRRGVS